MNTVAKLVIVDEQDRYLMLFRSAHPVFGNDPDLPGGTLESGEEPLDTMIREVEEEIGLMIDRATVRKLYEGNEYALDGTLYCLYETHMFRRPEIHMSWEHSAYEWLDRDVFLQKAKSANDTYMHMVYKAV